eukprot:jgi/Bigna1/138473/aug1.45_g13181
MGRMSISDVGVTKTSIMKWKAATPSLDFTERKCVAKSSIIVSIDRPNDEEKSSSSTTSTGQCSSSSNSYLDVIAKSTNFSFTILDDSKVAGGKDAGDNHE